MIGICTCQGVGHTNWNAAAQSCGHGGGIWLGEFYDNIMNCLIWHKGLESNGEHCDKDIMMEQLRS